MLVLTTLQTLQNICQLLIHVWRQANPATWNRTRDHLISAGSTVRCSTNWAIAGLTPTIEPPQHTLNVLPDAQIYWHLPRAKSLSHFCACHPCGAMEILRRRLSHFCACHPCGAMEILQGAPNSHGWLRRTYGLKFWRWRGASCVGDPCNSIRGASPGLASPEQASGKSHHAHVLAASHGQCGRAVEGGGSRRRSVRAWVRTPPLSLLHSKQIGAGGPKPEHFFRTRHHSFLAASGCV